MSTRIPFFIFICLGIFACKEDNGLPAEVTNLEYSFRAAYQGQPLVADEVYEYAGMHIRFEAVDFYISDLVLLQENSSGTQEIELNAIEFVDLLFDNATDAQQGVQFMTPQVETGNYEGLQIGIGVPADLNRTDWKIYAAGHPLGRESHYLNEWNSFIFCKLIGQIDVDKDGTFEKQFSYTAGRDPVFRSFVYAKSMNLSVDNTEMIRFVLQVDQLFENGGLDCDQNADQLIDIESPECGQTDSSDEQLTVADQLIRNFGDALRLE